KSGFTVLSSGLALLLAASSCRAQQAAALRNSMPAFVAAAGDGALPDAPAPHVPVPDPPAASVLPEAPEPNFPGAPRAATLESSSVVAVSRTQPRVPPEDCSLDTSHSQHCRVHWHQLIIEGTLFNAFLDAGNLYTGYWYRWETTHGDWFDRWINSAAGWSWNRWPDYNPFLDDYVGHPMMGAITNDIWIQNDPRSMRVTQSSTWPYWRSLLRAGTFSTAYSFWWKLGPTGEASIGHNGDHLIPDASGKHYSNETGWVELVTTPVGGALWTMAEDAMDKHVVAPIEGSGRNPFGLLGLSFLEPAHATANILRFRPPWYRDDRVVKAKTFWSDPPGVDEVRFEKKGSGSTGASGPKLDTASAASSSAVPGAEAAIVRGTRVHAYAPVYPYPGGVHEFGAWWGLSLISGHIWGYAGDIKYMPIDVRYTYLFSAHQHWTMRYAPEVTALAMLDQPVQGAKPTTNQPDAQYLRQRRYGSGISPVGFESDFFPSKRIQPFLSTNGGFLYFDDRVLSPQGSQFMYTIDFGTGIHVFRKARQDWTLGYRYQHLSNADISHHNPGTDTNVFYIAVSRFRTKGMR
ncbi:MAG: acyloxyacyl hydrolase, partial [Acidobacteriota bacterium]